MHRTRSKSASMKPGVPLPVTDVTIWRRFVAAASPVLLLLAVCGSILLPISARSEERVLIFNSGTSAIHKAVEAAISAALGKLCTEPTTCHTVEFRTVDVMANTGYQVSDQDAALIVTIGTKAAQAVADKPPSAPVLFTLIPRATFDKIPRSKLSSGSSAIYLDQPPERQLKLTQQISPTPEKIGILIGDTNLPYLDNLLSSAARLNISVVTETVLYKKQIGSKLNRLLKQSDLLLAVPDTSIYNRGSIFNILLSSYHSQVPVIGFSAAYVKAGAALGLYASPADIGRHAAETVHEYLSNKQAGLPSPAFARYFTIGVNSHVARSLDIDIPNALELKDRLQEARP